jgi:acyl-CoA thioester hydrolase
MGVVYYANHLVLFERGRTELLRSLGVRYRDLEEEGYYLPAADAQVSYAAPARYDDLLKIRTWVSKLGHASMTFGYEVKNAETGRLLAQGSTRHPVVNKSWKPVAMPPRVRAALLQADPSLGSSPP